MKATEVAKRIVELTGRSTNAEALQAIEHTLEALAQPKPPITVTVVIDTQTGAVYPGITGASAPSSDVYGLIQSVLRQYAESLEQAKVDMLKRELASARDQNLKEVAQGQV